MSSTDCLVSACPITRAPGFNRTNAAQTIPVSCLLVIFHLLDNSRFNLVYGNHAQSPQRFDRRMGASLIDRAQELNGTNTAENHGPPKEHTLRINQEPVPLAAVPIKVLDRQ